MITQALLSLLTTFVSVESAKRYISDTIATWLSKPHHGTLLHCLQPYQRKTTFYEYTFQEVFYDGARESIFRYFQHYGTVLSARNSNPQNH